MLLPTLLAMSATEATACRPVTLKPTRRPATWSPMSSSATSALRGLACGASRFCRFTFRQSPSATRSTSGRGRLSGRSSTSPGVAAPPLCRGTMCLSTTSRRKAKIMPLTFCAPRRLNISGWSRATTSATRVRRQSIAASAAAAPSSRLPPSSRASQARLRPARACRSCGIRPPCGTPGKLIPIIFASRPPRHAGQTCRARGTTGIPVARAMPAAPARILRRLAAKRTASGAFAPTAAPIFPNAGEGLRAGPAGAGSAP